MSDEKGRDRDGSPTSPLSSSSSSGTQRTLNGIREQQLVDLKQEIDSVAAKIDAKEDKLEDLCAQRRQAVIDEKVQLGQLLAEDIDKLEQSIADLKAKENKLLEQRRELTQSLSGNTVSDDIVEELVALRLEARLTQERRVEASELTHLRMTHPQTPQKTIVSVSGSSVPSSTGGFRYLTADDIVRCCNLSMRPPSKFSEDISKFGALPDVKDDIVSTIVSILEKIISGSFCMRLERARSLLIDPFLYETSDGKNVVVFPEENCPSEAFLRKGAIDYVIGQPHLLESHPSIKVVAVEAKPSIDDIKDHLPQWIAEMDAVTNGGELGFGALSDGFSWWFAIQRKKRPNFQQASSPDENHSLSSSPSSSSSSSSSSFSSSSSSSSPSSSSFPASATTSTPTATMTSNHLLTDPQKPTITVTASEPYRVINVDKTVNESMVKVVVQHLLHFTTVGKRAMLEIRQQMQQQHIV